MSALAGVVLDVEVLEGDVLDEQPPAPLTAAQARRKTRQLRKALNLALDLLTEVFEGRVWEALGHPTWEAYCAAELPELTQLRLSVDERRMAVAALRGSGMSTRAIAAPLGLSVGTVHRDLQAVGVHLATVTSLDGRQRPATAPAPAATSKPAASVCKTDRTLALVAAAGADGMTVHELCARTGWHHGQASATLTRLAQRGLLHAGPVRRQAAAAYLLSSSPALLG